MKTLYFFFIFLGLLLGITWWVKTSSSVSKSVDKSSFVILKGSNAAQIGNKLKSEKLIRSSFAFNIFVRLTGKSQKIQAGEYELSPNFSLLEIVKKLTSGPDMVWVTIPEGLRREEVAVKIATILKRDEDFENGFLVLTQDKEGLLFPDTYLFPRDVDPEIVVNRMIFTFEKRLDSALKSAIVSSGYSTQKVITMASIIERETRNKEEKSVVAGILYKRIKAGWPLQADATVQYAKANMASRSKNSKLDKWWPTLLKGDLNIKSPYNTYIIKDLPVSPIANPGIASIKAAIYPQASEYWFYLHDTKGKIHYAKTIEEHNLNIANYIN